MNKLIILDIDETLVYSTFENLNREPDFYFKGRSVYLRPYLAMFLKHCIENYDVAVWTSARAEYARYILKKIAGDLSMFKFIYTRKNCQRVSKWNGFMNEDVYIKDLTRIKEYTMAEMVMIDDNPVNIIPSERVLKIEEYRGDAHDKELMRLTTVDFFCFLKQ